jgi:light-regulated signal transduction histidine kinase (bacteriophytochrome)
MAEVVAGFLTSAVVKIAVDKLSSAIAEQGNLAWNFSHHLQDMKDTMESMAAVLKDAEKESVEMEQARLWLKRLKTAAQGISDMMDDYQDPDTQTAEQVRKNNVSYRDFGSKPGSTENGY